MFYYVEFTGWSIKNYKFSTHYDESHEDCTTCSGKFIYLGDDNEPILNMFRMRGYCKKLIEKRFDKWTMMLIRSHAVNTKQEMFTSSNGYYWNFIEMTKQDYLYENGCTFTNKHTNLEIFDERSFLQKIKDLFKSRSSH